jgi:hypothetical protein
MKALYGTEPVTEQDRGVGDGAVAEAYLDDFRRGSENKTTLMEISVFGDNGISMRSGIAPNFTVTGCPGRGDEHGRNLDKDRQAD